MGASRLWLRKNLGGVHGEIEKKCSEKLILKNGHVRLQLRGGVTAVFTCDVGYTIRGSNVSHCQTDGHWSAPSPTCIPNDQKCFLAEIETILLHSGKSISINCSRDMSIENGHIFWVANSTNVKTTFINQDILMATTTIPGIYTCLMYTSSEISIVRTVNIISSDPLFTPKSLEECSMSFRNITSNISLDLGSNLSISCEVFPQPAKLSWLKNGKVLYINNEPHSSHFLNIPNVQKSDEGNYTCIAHTHFPQCTKTKSVIVKIETPSEMISNFACGQPVKSVRRWRRVIDGVRAASLSAPWMGMMTIEQEPPFCGCSLITQKWVVTAAHCFRSSIKGNSTFLSPEIVHRKVRVKFGKQLRRQFEVDEVVRSIRTLVIYPEFGLMPTARNVANEHDIALIELDKPVMFQPSVLPVCLPPPGFMQSIPTGSLGVVTGWGRVSVRDSVMAQTLQEAYLPLVNNSVCQQNSNYVITDNMICAGYAESYRPDTCSGDSGGPFVLKQLNSWFLIGVVSWGEGCSNPLKYGIYTKVERYVPWIQSVILKNP
ncbi:hypothetical protein JTE90_021722 [Oedothorax gibbosus]|uniref:limulus clotting factor C n=1 Tax=Oedothorax gibbosus TaxID=931172 RepID=A0AAV6UED0_9ARAC|nr:hypothetical protein JTE90_021722 [Oedothorax gibbosus]